MSHICINALTTVLDHHINMCVKGGLWRFCALVTVVYAPGGEGVSRESRTRREAKFPFRTNCCSAVWLVNHMLMICLLLVACAGAPWPP
jgi:hypothetical protein